MVKSYVKSDVIIIYITLRKEYEYCLINEVKNVKYSIV